MDVIIGRAEISDLTEVAKLFDAYRVFYEQESDLQLAFNFLSDRVQNSESVILYAKTGDGQYVGFTQLYPNFSSVSARRIWVLNDLYVVREARGLGIGKKLLNKAKEYAVASKAKGITLTTAKSNINAQKLYESLGYKKDTEFFSYFLNLQHT